MFMCLCMITCRILLFVLINFMTMSRVSPFILMYCPSTVLQLHSSLVGCTIVNNTYSLGKVAGIVRRCDVALIIAHDHILLVTVALCRWGK